MRLQLIESLETKYRVNAKKTFMNFIFSARSIVSILWKTCDERNGMHFRFQNNERRPTALGWSQAAKIELSSFQFNDCKDLFIMFKRTLTPTILGNIYLGDYGNAGGSSISMSKFGGHFSNRILCRLIDIDEDDIVELKANAILHHY